MTDKQDAIDELPEPMFWSAANEDTDTCTACMLARTNMCPKSPRFPGQQMTKYVHRRCHRFLLEPALKRRRYKAFEEKLKAGL
jgi:hypothetical protein